MLISFATHPITELLAVLCFLLYVTLSARGSIWCWAAGFLTSFFYTFIFIGAHLPGQVALYIVYMMMSIWGWSVWLENRKPEDISVYSFSTARKHLLLLPVVLIIALGTSLLLPSYFESSKPYFEAIVIALSIYATILTVYRKIESWIFWFVINLASFVLLLNENLMQTSAMHCGVALISGWGFYNWRCFRKRDEASVAME